MEHFHENIQGWFNCEHLYRFMVERAQDGARFVEIGVWKGKSAAFMAVEIINSGKKIDLFLVDHFKGSLEHQDDPQVLNDSLEAQCKANLEPVSHMIKYITMSSVAAASTFPDESLDFVYVDGSHEYQDIKDDIEAWLPKIKKGGVIAGDDYGVGRHPDVQKIIDELFPFSLKHGLVWIQQKV